MHGLVGSIGSLRAAVLGANTSRFGPSASGWGPGSSHEPRSAIPGPALPLVSVDPASARHRSARDCRSLASGRLLLLLALEITLWGWAVCAENLIRVDEVRESTRLRR